jgi:hypothetical protein
MPHLECMSRPAVAAIDRAAPAFPAGRPVVTIILAKRRSARRRKGAISQGLAGKVALQTMGMGFSHVSQFSDANRRLPRIRCAASAPPQRLRARALRAMIVTCLAATALAGCAGGLDNVHTGNIWVQPGKYEFLKCPDIAQRSMADSTREKQLVSLMERANQETAGPLVNAMVYSADLHQVRADLELLTQTAREKGCDSIVPKK